MPPQKEVDEPELTRIPFRNWCADFIKGKAANHGHYRQDKEDEETPVISIDYIYLKAKEKDQTKEEGQPIIVLKTGNPRQLQRMLWKRRE